MVGSPHYLRLGRTENEFASPPTPEEHSQRVLAWLSAVMQAEHLNLLVGSGFTTAVASIAGVTAAGMDPVTFSVAGADEVSAAAKGSAARLGRSEPDLEDQLRMALQLLGGLEIEDTSRAREWRKAINGCLTTLGLQILRTERELREPLLAVSGDGPEARDALVGFLLAFAHRSASRDRLHVFTTNYDRLIEHGCDLAGLRCLDRFVGALEPMFRASRVDVDLHYNPPGMRGEPRYLEGVLRLSKLHGSLDWRSGSAGVRRVDLPFGAGDDHAAVPDDPLDSLLIYPNAAKDVETLEYPYAELSRDAAAALCRPNTALVTYGYGFGDDHVNRVIADMLTIPSTHLVVISYDWARGRLRRFIDVAGRASQTTLLVGSHFADLRSLIDNYLPNPSLERLTAHQIEWLDRRQSRGSGRHIDSAEV